MQVNTEEWQFFLKGGSVLDRSQQAANPASTWISEEAWDNVTELDLLPNFKGIASSFESSAGTNGLVSDPLRAVAVGLLVQGMMKKL